MQSIRNEQEVIILFSVEDESLEFKMYIGNEMIIKVLSSFFASVNLSLTEFLRS